MAHNYGARTAEGAGGGRAADAAPFAYPETHLDRVVMRFFDEVEINKLAATLEAAE